MAWRKHEIIWTPEVRLDLLKIAEQNSMEVADCLRESMRRYANRGFGDVLDPMTAGPWRGLSRLKPANADEYRIIFTRFPMQALIRVERVRLRPVVYLDPPPR